MRIGATQGECGTDLSQSRAIYYKGRWKYNNNIGPVSVWAKPWEFSFQDYFNTSELNYTTQVLNGLKGKYNAALNVSFHTDSHNIIEQADIRQFVHGVRVVEYVVENSSQKDILSEINEVKRGWTDIDITYTIAWENPDQNLQLRFPVATGIKNPSSSVMQLDTALYFVTRHPLIQDPLDYLEGVRLWEQPTS